MIILLIACHSPSDNTVSTPTTTAAPTATSLIVLGTIQDAGSPHIGCKKACCVDLFDSPDPTRQVVSLGIWDKSTDKTYILDASPDMSRQITHLET